MSDDEDDVPIPSQTPKRKLDGNANGGSKKSKGDTQYLHYALDEEDEQQLLLSEGKNWGRPPLRNIDPEKDSIVFQQLDIDYTLGDPIPGMPGSQVGPVPIVRMYGVTEEGNSVQCNIHGYTPYFFIPAPNGFKDSHCESFRAALNKRMENASSYSKVKEYVVKVDIIQKESIMNFSFGRKRNFVRIFMAIPKMVATLRNILETSFDYPPLNLHQYRISTYESDIPFVLRFMIDKAVVGGGWVEVHKGSYKILDESDKNSNCQLELDLAHDSFTTHAPEGDWSKLAPIRILSFDIECAGRKGVFPEPEHDPVIQIANLVTRIGETKPFIRNVFNLRSCASIVGAQVIPFTDERHLLREWKNFVRTVDPDIIIGYNIANFDFPYLINRAKQLKVDDFLYLGRVKDSKARMKDATFSSKAYGKRESKEITIEGRVQFDVLQVIQREHKLRSYTLNAVSAHFLNEQKEEVHHSIITDLFNGSYIDRRRLAVYCLKDAYLPQRLLDKLMLMYNHIEMARVTGVPISYLLSRGQQIKVLSQLYRKAGSEDLLIPYYKNNGGGDDGESYEGATVIEPVRGYHDTPITTLDFASLYPSIMMAHNLCYSTLLKQNDAKAMTPDDYEITPYNNCCFVKTSVKEGILPRILRELLSARKKAKDDLKNEKDPFKRAVLDGRQLALKITANSVYGFTGATIGKLPSFEISGSVTAYGRGMIMETKDTVEKHYSKANGFAADAQVIYGDTDSVMVKFGVTNLEEAMQLGREASKLVTAKFIRPIQLEFEKVYYPYLLISKKRYAGLLWTNPNKSDKIDAKGIETVRRDNCPLVKNVISTSLQKILVDRDTEGAKEYVKGIISDLLLNRLDLSLLVISKALSKEGSEYKGKQAHVELAEKMRARDAHSAPNIGDRVPYVIIKSTKGAKAYEKAEDPLYVLENNIPLDYQYYLENQLQKPLTRIFEPIMGEDKVKSLLQGAHTRSISVPTPKVGGIMGFVTQIRTCLSCKSKLTDEEATVCHNCRGKEAELYQNQINIVSNLEKNFSRVWTQCQVCQGSMHQPVLCTSRDCPIFYMRKKIQKDLQDAQDLLEKFEISW